MDSAVDEGIVRAAIALGIPGTLDPQHAAVDLPARR